MESSFEALPSPTAEVVETPTEVVETFVTDTVESVATTQPTEIIPSKARPKRIVIDPGHGGPDYPGAVYRDATGGVDLVEKDINLRVALLLADFLRSDGYEVILTREGDYTLTPFNEGTLVDRVKGELQTRAELANKSSADILVSIHFNGHDDDTLAGTEVYYCQDRPFGQKSRFLAQLIQSAIVSELRQEGYKAIDRGIKDDTNIGRRFGYEHSFLLGENPGFEQPSQMPGVIGEALFITKHQEAALLRQPQMLDAIAQGYRRGIIRYFEEDSG